MCGQYINATILCAFDLVWFIFTGRRSCSMRESIKAVVSRQCKVIKVKKERKNWRYFGRGWNEWNEWKANEVEWKKDASIRAIWDTGTWWKRRWRQIISFLPSNCHFVSAINRESLLENYMPRQSSFPSIWNVAEEILLMPDANSKKKNKNKNKKEDARREKPGRKCASIESHSQVIVRENFRPTNECT